MFGIIPLSYLSSRHCQWKRKQSDDPGCLIIDYARTTHYATGTIKNHHEPHRFLNSPSLKASRPTLFSLKFNTKPAAISCGSQFYQSEGTNWQSLFWRSRNEKVGLGFRNEWVAHFYVVNTTDELWTFCDGKSLFVLTRFSALPHDIAFHRQSYFSGKKSRR